LQLLSARQICSRLTLRLANFMNVSVSANVNERAFIETFEISLALVLSSNTLPLRDDVI
jgi:hypothetical protein